jgi:hypothetical protein
MSLSSLAGTMLLLGAINLGLMALIFVLIISYAEGDVEALFYAGTTLQAMGSIVLAASAMLVLAHATEERLRAAGLIGGVTGFLALSAVAYYHLWNLWGAAWMFYGPLAVLALAGAGIQRGRASAEGLSSAVAERR